MSDWPHDADLVSEIDREPINAGSFDVGYL